RFDHLHRLDVEHRERRAARESVARLGIDDRAVATAVDDLTERGQRLEVKDGDATQYGWSCWRRVRRRDGADRVPRDVEAASDGIGVDVVRPTLAANARALEHLIHPAGRGLLCRRSRPFRLLRSAVT